MRTSNVGIELIKRFESLHDGDLSQIGLQPKMCPSLIWTSGWGNALVYNGKFLRGAENKDLAYAIGTVKDIKEADWQLAKNLQKFEKIVLGKLKVKLNQNQFDALVSHTYNTGGSNTLFRLINENAGREKIYNWFTTKYITGNGVKLKGLIRRRKAEADLFFSK
jgi:lysozyme